MKIPIARGSRAIGSGGSPYRASPPRGNEGMAVIVVLALVSIIMIYLAFNLRTLACLEHELRLLDRQQTRRLHAATLSTAGQSRTNQPPAVGGAP